MQLLISSLIVISQLIVRSSTTLLVFLWGLIQLLFIANLFSYFYESQWVNKPKNDLIKARKLSTDFFVYRWIMAKSLKVIFVISILRKQLGKQNNDEHGAIFFLDLNIKKRDRQLQIGHSDKRDSFPFLLSEYQTIQAMYHLK